MNVLIGCEFSGIVRDAFLYEGHDAISCDLLPSERPGPHVQGDLLRYLAGVKGTPRWPDLPIAFPPCQYLCNSGVRWLYGGAGSVIDPIRWAHMERAARFFRRILRLPIARIAAENSVMHRFGRELVGRRQDQIVQPHWFGHGEIKATAFWLKGLPPLVPTRKVSGRVARVHHASPGPDRWKERSRTLPGVADAMARQWGR